MKEMRVFDGKDYVDKIKLADKMHFAAESLEAVVMMIVQAIKAMIQGTTQQESTSACGMPLRVTNDRSEQPRKISLAEMWADDNSDCELQQGDAHDPLGLNGRKPTNGQGGSAKAGQSNSQDPLGIFGHQREKEISIIHSFVVDVDEYREKKERNKQS
jgi:hypothetical protein